MDSKINTLFRTILITMTALALGSGPVFAAATINGAGATFPYPIYAQWAWQYNNETGVKLNYQSIAPTGGL
jgi:phosphate transport system substrate-binding protein